MVFGIDLVAVLDTDRLPGEIEGVRIGVDDRADLPRPKTREVKVVIAFEVMNFDSAAYKFTKSLDDRRKLFAKVLVTADPKIKNVTDKKEMRGSFIAKFREEMKKNAGVFAGGISKVNVGNKVSFRHVSRFNPQDIKKATVSSGFLNSNFQNSLAERQVVFVLRSR